MNLFIKKFITNTILVPKKGHKKKGEHFSRYEIAKGYRILKNTSIGLLKDAIFIILGILHATFGLEAFLLPNKFIDGGVTGISLLVSNISGIPLFVLILVINVPFVFLGYKVIGKVFALKTAFAILGLSLSVAFIHFPQITHTELLVAVFGGFFLGAGVGLAVRGGSVLDGTEVLAIYLSRKFGITIGEVIIGINILVFSAAAYFLSMESALYSMITYLVASRTIDFVVDGIDEYTGVTIISAHSDEIRKMIMEKMGRGLTVYRGKRGYGSHGERNDVDIVYTVVTRLELNKLNSEIQKIDINAFVVMNSVKDTKGGMIKKRALNH